MTDGGRGAVAVVSVLWVLALLFWVAPWIDRLLGHRPSAIGCDDGDQMSAAWMADWDRGRKSHLFVVAPPLPEENVLEFKVHPQRYAMVRMGEGRTGT